MQLMAAFEPPADDLTPSQRALLDGIALLSGGQPGCWADSRAVSRWAKAERGVWVAGGGVQYSLQRRGLIEAAWVHRPRKPGRTIGVWGRSGTVLRLTAEGMVEQFAGADA